MVLSHLSSFQVSAQIAPSSRKPSRTFHAGSGGPPPYTPHPRLSPDLSGASLSGDKSVSSTGL